MHMTYFLFELGRKNINNTNESLDYDMFYKI